MDTSVSWFQWGGGRLIDSGRMRRSEIAQTLRKFELEAQKLLKETGADHVLYGAKWYDENGLVSKVSFYMEPMIEEQFEKNVARLADVQVYAVHARKRKES